MEENEFSAALQTLTGSLKYFREHRRVDRAAFAALESAQQPQLAEFARTLQTFLQWEQAADIERQRIERQLKAREHAARIYFDYALTAIIETDDPTWQISQANPAAASITGFEIRELTTQCLAQLVPETHRTYAEATLELLKEQGISHAEWQMKRRDGTLITIEISSINVGDDHYIHVFDDVTEQRATTQKLDAARRAAEAASEAKSHFLANISHEIRTPLNGILGLTQLCLRTQLNSRQREYLDMISQSGGALLQIINDLLDFAKIEAGRMEFEHIGFSLNEMLDELAVMVSQSVADKSIEVIFRVAPSVPGHLVGDRLRVFQCLNNLLSNAAKFTTSGLVALNIAVEPHQGEQAVLRFTVSDTGIGIDQEVLDRLFQPFSQAEASISRRFGGTGLGLVIVRELTRGMGGRMQVESTPGQGSHFTLCLPFDTVPEKPRQPEHGGRALIVSARQATLEAVSDLFHGLGWEVDARSSLKDSTDLPSHDLVMIDYALGYPRMDDIQRIVLAKASPILILTGIAENSERMAAWEAGAGCEVLTRPLTPNLLARALERLGLRESTSPVKASSAMGAVSNEFAGVHIVVAEDNHVNQLVVLDMLQQAGIQTTLANNGQELLDILHAMPELPDAILMDVQMPGMDGVEATRILREEGYTLPILALTAGASHLEQASSLEAGMNDFLTKPVDFDELWGALTRWIPPKTQHKPDKEETAEDRFLDRPDILLKARQVFIEVHAQDAILLFQMMNDGEFEQMARVAHAIKGSSRTIGENDLAAVAAEIEQAAKLGNLDALMPLIHQLQLLLSQFQR